MAILSIDHYFKKFAVNGEKPWRSANRGIQNSFLKKGISGFCNSGYDLVDIIQMTLRMQERGILPTDKALGT